MLLNVSKVNCDFVTLHITVKVLQHLTETKAELCVPDFTLSCCSSGSDTPSRRLRDVCSSCGWLTHLLCHSKLELASCMGAFCLCVLAPRQAPCVILPSVCSSKATLRTCTQTLAVHTLNLIQHTHTVGISSAVSRMLNTNTLGMLGFPCCFQTA